MRCACTLIIVGVFCGVAGGAEPLSERIDAIVSAAHDGSAAPRISDAEFLRRVSLDLAGVIPSAAHARDFLSDDSPKKRRALIDQLLAGSEFSRRMQQVFSVMLLERRTGAIVADEDWESYLQSSFAENKPLDQLMREILSEDGSSAATRPAMKFYLVRGAADYKTWALDVGRLLQGRNLECAQCHDHPAIDDFKQAEFYGVVAFLNHSYLHRNKADNAAFLLEKNAGPPIEFTSVFTSESQLARPQILGGPVVDIPEFEKGTEPKDAATVGLPKSQFSLRPLLAEHIASSSNRAFSRNLANRLWAMMMGRGLVHPLDMHHSGNPASHPELLDALADELVASRFNVRHLLRELALSETYQRASRLSKANDIKSESFAVFNLKPLSAEQLAFSMMRAAGIEQRVLAAQEDKAATAKYRPDKGRPMPAENLDNVLKLFRSIYAAQPGQPDDEFAPSIAAALFAENDSVILGWLTPTSGNLIARLSMLGNAQAVADELYISILTRLPTEEERAAVADYLDSDFQREALLREMAWALLASTEFRFNH